MVLPEGFALPPLRYLGPLLVVLVTAGALLWTVRPRVTDRVVLAVVPWMVAGAGAHALYAVGALPGAVEPLFGVPAVYLSVGALAAVVWVLAAVTTSTWTHDDPALYLFIGGLLAAVLALAAAVAWGLAAGELALLWPGVGLVVSVALTAAVWALVHRWFPRTAALAAWTGVVVVFGHALDGVSTAIGVDVLDGVERSPVADAVIWLGSRLPTAAVLGDTWLFVLVKLALPVAILVLFRDYLDESPDQARLLLAVIAAVGLGPGVHNLLLFMLAL